MKEMKEEELQKVREFEGEVLTARIKAYFEALEKATVQTASMHVMRPGPTYIYEMGNAKPIRIR